MSVAPRIWIVDDEADMRAFLRLALEDAGYLVREFASARVVVTAAVAEPPDLIYMDIMMPVRSGLSLFREIRENSALDEIPVVVISGYTRPEEDITEEFARLLGDTSLPAPDGFLDKPVSLVDLLDLTASLVRRREGRSA